MGESTRSRDDFTCHYDGCGRQRLYGDLCRGHDKQLRIGRGLRPISGTGKAAARPVDCSFEDCTDPVSAGTPGPGLCGGHLLQLRRKGALTSKRPFLPPGAKECSRLGCATKSRAYGLCPKHAARKAYRDKNPIDASYKVCPVEGCQGEYTLRAGLPMCLRHRSHGIKYGLDAAGVVALWDDAKCAMCGETEDLHIDHDHACCDNPKGGSCGACVRGLLCANCNHLLGFAGDKPERLMAAVAYLDAFAARPVRLVA